MADEIKKDKAPEPKTETPIGDCIVEIVASADRKINMGNYESAGIFLSVKVQIPKHGDPELMIPELLAYVDRHATLEERRIRDKRKA